MGRRDKRRKVDKKLRKKGLIPEKLKPHEVPFDREEHRDPRSRWSSVDAGGLEIGFDFEGPKVPVDMDSDEAPKQLRAGTLDHMLGEQGDGES